MYKCNNFFYNFIYIHLVCNRINLLYISIKKCFHSTLVGFSFFLDNNFYYVIYFQHNSCTTHLLATNNLIKKKKKCSSKLYYDYLFGFVSSLFNIVLLSWHIIFFKTLFIELRIILQWLLNLLNTVHVFFSFILLENNTFRPPRCSYVKSVVIASSYCSRRLIFLIDSNKNNCKNFLFFFFVFLSVTQQLLNYITIIIMILCNVTAPPPRNIFQSFMYVCMYVIYWVNHRLYTRNINFHLINDFCRELS